ncbi:MAG: T9SS type A sorting domain-containing protein [Melioribacteraceae bacterium]|nr:T9SS type A sorting domain-containing protein [Melioribacteraceae bacterium]
MNDEKEEIVNKFSLSQNYPNPFNPTTSIKYQVSSSEKVILKVYDILGREIKTLVNEVKSPGSYEVQFDASQLASGVYFYRLTAVILCRLRR